MNKQLFTLLIAFGSFIGGTNVYAQKTKAEIYGLGRAVVQLDGMKDESDTTNFDEGRGSGGYTLLDMGFKVQKGDILKADMILRYRNEYGGFYINGQPFDFRQIRLSGVIGGAVKYAIGDLDMVLTPYTLYNSDVEFHKYESDLFAIRREVIDYEQFYTDENTWRTQGVDLSFGLKFAKGIEKLGFRAFGNRIIAAVPTASTPDRWIFGGRMDVKQSKYLSLGFNALSMRDMGSTVTDPVFEYKNDVYTADWLFDYNELEKLRFNVGGEAGISQYNSTRSADDSTVSYDDGFYEAFVRVTYKPLNVYLKAGYKSVGATFSSPTAQTRRINDFGDPLVYPNYLNGETRYASIQDRYSQEYGLYDKTISANLMAYNPIFGNINPYGEATANRQGLDLELGTVDTNFYELTVRFELKEEVAIENPDNVNNTTGLREFTGIEVGGKLYINQFFNFEKEISIIGGLRQEQTKRSSETNPVDLTSTQIDFGLDIEPVRRLHVLLGYKSLSAEGNELQNSRDEFNRLISTPQNVNYDLTNTVIATGIVYDFNFNAQFSVHANFQNWTNNFDYENDNFKYYGTEPYNFEMNQVYINYTQRF